MIILQTTYLRQAPSSSYKSTVHDHSAGEGDAEKTPRTSAMSEVETHDFDHDALPTSSTPPTFPSQLRIYNGTFSEESLWRIFLRPFPFLLSPVVRVHIPRIVSASRLIVFARLADMVYVPYVFAADGVVEYVSRY